MNNELSNTSPNETTVHPLFAFIFEHCKTQYLQQRRLFTANITICGMDYYCLADTEIDAKLDLCNMLMKSKYIINNFKPQQ